MANCQPICAPSRRTIIDPESIPTEGRVASEPAVPPISLQSSIETSQSEHLKLKAQGNKRPNEGQDHCEKRRRLSDHKIASSKEDIPRQAAAQSLSIPAYDAQSCPRSETAHQLLLPSPTRSEGATVAKKGLPVHQPAPLVHTYNEGPSDEETRENRSRLLSSPAPKEDSVQNWLANLPSTHVFDEIHKLNGSKATSQPSQSDSETSVFVESKHSVYEDPNYSINLELKGSFKKDSEEGLVTEDLELCQNLLEYTQQVPNDDLFDDLRFSRFLENLKGRSEARICTDLHPRLAPSIENLFISGREEFRDLREGYNDIWDRSIPFHGPRPQPNHTYGYKWSTFTEQQRRKLKIDFIKPSLYTACIDIYFPFLTVEVRSCYQVLRHADNANTNSMCTIIRGIVDLYRRLKREHELHRRVVCFSMSHDDNDVRFYAHYPEIHDGKLSYWRHPIGTIDLKYENGKDRQLPYNFVINTCQIFALPFVERIKSLIDQLDDPLSQPSELRATLDDTSMLGSQDESSASQDDPELKSMIQELQQQLQQHQDWLKERKQQHQDWLKQNEQQHQDWLKQNEQQCQDRLKEREQQCQDRLKEREQQHQDWLEQNEQEHQDWLKEHEHELKEHEQQHQDWLEQNEQELKEHEQQHQDWLEQNEQEHQGWLKEREQQHQDWLKEREQQHQDWLKQNEQQCQDWLKQNEQEHQDRLKELTEM